MAIDWFLALDGDDVGRSLELCMLTNDVEGLLSFASDFSKAVAAVLDKVRTFDGVEILLAGGDSLLVKIPDEDFELVLAAVTASLQDSKFTFSGGYGSTMREAYLALKLAKSTGKNRIEGPLATEAGS